MSFFKVWDVKTMEQVTELTGHVGIIYSLQVLDGPSPGGARLFSACYDKTLRVSHNQYNEVSRPSLLTIYQLCDGLTIQCRL